MKIKLFLICLFSLLLFSCSTNIENNNSSFNTTTLYENKKVSCYYLDSFSIEEQNNIKKIVKLDGESFPLFSNYFWIDLENKINEQIPDFLIAGDEITFKIPYTVQIDSKGYYIDSHNPITGGKISSYDIDFKYTRTKVERIDQSRIIRNEDGTIKEIANMMIDENNRLRFSHITIDKNYNYISLNDYKGEEIFVSYFMNSNIIARLYSFNPLN